MVGIIWKGHTESVVASKASNTLHDAFRFEFDGSPVPLVFASGSANVDDGVEPSSCSCSSVAPRLSVLASQCRRNGRDLSITESQSGKTRIGGTASPARRAPTAFSIAGVKSNKVTGFSRAVIGRMRRATLDRNLR